MCPEVVNMVIGARVSEKKDKKTLGFGIRTTLVTVTDTPQSIPELLAAVSGKVVSDKLEVLGVHNVSETEQMIYILQAEDQSLTHGTRLAADQERVFDASPTFYLNLPGNSAAIQHGLYFAAAESEEVSMIITEYA